MFESYLIHQEVDPQLRKRFVFAMSTAVAATLMSGVLLWTTEKMQISRVSAPTSDFLIFSLDEVEAPPPPKPPAAPAAAEPERPDTPEDPEDILEDPESPPDEVPDEIPSPRRSKGDVLENIGGGGGGNPFGQIGDPTSTCIVGCGPAIAQRSKPVESKPPKEVDFSALTCRVCPDPAQKQLQQTSAALMGRRGLSNRTRFCVESNGKVASVSTRKSAGDKDVDRIIKETVRSWRFAPMMVDGRPRKTCSTASFDIRFE